MGEMFMSKVRPIGGSACVIIPQEQLEQNNITIGEEIEVAIFTHKRDHSAFGSVVEKVPFKRDKKVREFK